jgi:AraC-like DNA-binding protein
MRYTRIKPSPAAARFVRHYWTLEAGPANDVQRIVPDGAPELILHLADPFEAAAGAGWQQQPTCFFAGQLTGPLLLRPAGMARILGVSFRPNGLAALGFPARDLAGRFEPATRWFRDIETVPELETRLLEMARRSDDPVITESLRRIDHAPGARDLGSIARDLGVSTRQFERRFVDAVGLPPKVYERIRRFQRVFPLIESGQPWAGAALACGYYDQAHLIRDFREFAGTPPASLLASGGLARHFLSHFSKTDEPALR